MDHLTEFPKYYDDEYGLPAMEKKLKQEEEFPEEINDSKKKLILDFIKNFKGEIDDEDFHEYVAGIKVQPWEAEDVVYNALKAKLNSEEV